MDYFSSFFPLSLFFSFSPSLSLSNGLSLSLSLFFSFSLSLSLTHSHTLTHSAGVRDMLDGIGMNITGFSKLFPVHNSLTNFTIFISHSHSRIEDLYPEIDRYDFYRYLPQAFCMP